MTAWQTERIPDGRLRIAIQKSGRLTDKCLTLFRKCGVDFDLRKDRLLHECKEFPVDLMLVRDDDIPEYVADGVCELGVVGRNVIEEKGPEVASRLQTVMPMGFGECRLSIAVSDQTSYRSPKDLQGRKIATSYPKSLRRFLDREGVQAQIVELSGSVEIAPSLRIADAICDLVSTGGTLRSNGLVEVQTIMESEALLVRNVSELPPLMLPDFGRLLQRIHSVMKAAQSKYVMMNATRSALPRIREIMPGMEAPSIMSLGSSDERIAIHAVSREAIFWETIEQLKAVGASSILVLPIEKVIA